MCISVWTRVHVCGLGKISCLMEAELGMSQIIEDFICHDGESDPESNGDLLGKFKSEASKI